MTIHIPDDKHSRLKALARHRHVSVNKLIEELSTQALAEFDSEVRFRTLAARGDLVKGLEILDKLDTHFSEGWLAPVNLKVRSQDSPVFEYQMIARKHALAFARI